MGGAIDFDDEANAGGAKIGDKALNRKLTPEFDTTDLVLVQSLPEFGFGRGERFAHLAGERLEFMPEVGWWLPVVAGEHKPPPNLPQLGGGTVDV